ncbi:hypothetical protein TNCV_4080701 [Trichonephila clavipes]|nr:hypothetical protein TNCV_4080701 [Trichonephila clavipes]
MSQFGGLSEERPSVFKTRSKLAIRGLLATDHVILNHGQVTWTTPELAPPSPIYHTNGRTFQLSTDLTCIAALHGGSLEGRVVVYRASTPQVWGSINWLGGEGIVRVVGRLENASVPYLHKPPAILPKG